MNTDEYQTTDMKLIILLLIEKQDVLKTKKNENGKTVFFFNKEKIQPQIALWASGKPISKDIREFFSAYEIFNMYVHGEI
jgi:hypothetical protein